MKPRNRSISAILFVLIVLLPKLETEAQTSGKNIQVGPQPDGSILVPTNQLLRPAGQAG